MTTPPRGKAFPKGRGGNPSGRPKGARNKALVALDALLDGEGEVIVKKAIELAKDGDTVALRLCLERLIPPRKDRPVAFTLPKLETPADAVKASAALLEAVAGGDLTPSEAAELQKLVDGFTQAIHVHDIDARLRRLEGDQ
ncbi:DUF5681 domain-containing protein [Salinarimonas soli]|uniref:DUF5681 domain-containing protein n=1 Tax=Salinarimonas soli TaxID=1638099 RepID=A0A5B2VSR9_9HYPH|nr:DUF5681 domain-containing protein [Salinarimonas soli]KAA2241149.1 hypothetical protein F0L46_04955 [Salinarimonas soli]